MNRLLFSPLTLLAWSLLFLHVPGQSLLAQSYRPATAYLGSDASPAQIEAHLIGQFPELQSPNVGLTLGYQRYSPGGRHLHFQQTYQGLPIYQAGVKANLDRNGRLRSLLPHLQTPEGRKAMGDFLIDPAAFEARFVDLVEAQQLRYEPQWLAQPEGWLPIYRVETHQPGPVFAYEWLIDARNGQELQRRDLGAYCRPWTDSTGRGRVFIPDPCTRAEVEYDANSPYADRDDQHSVALEGSMDTVELLDLTVDGGLYRLEGPHVKIEDIQSFNFEPATSLNGDFFYPRDDSRFEDVMVYYHIDRYQRYVQSLGFTNLQNSPFRADPHGINNSDQSVFVPNQGDSYALFGDGGVDDAEDADVIIHEYAHALSYAAAPDTRVGKERQGLDEGMGDYLAASYSYDLNPWRWFEVFNWDGHNEFWHGRMAITTETYPLDANASIYDLGSYWASTLMAIRMDLGREVTDQLFLQSLYGSSLNMTLIDGARLILEADSLLFQGSHYPQLTQKFCEFSLLQSVDCIAVGMPTAKNPSDLSVSQLAEGDYLLDWSGQAARCELVNLMGKTLWSSPLTNGQTYRIPLQRFPSGVYLLRVIDGPAQPMTRKLIRR